MESTQPHPFDKGNGFVPARRDVDVHAIHDAPIRPLIDRLIFITKKTSWAYPFRFGPLKVAKPDFVTIAEAMGLDLNRIE